MKYLIVVDMQNDFISGSLGSEQAKHIVNNVLNKIEGFDGKIIFTRDTHKENYLDTREGRKLPVIHCVRGTWGHQICDELKEYAVNVIDKETFGSVDLPLLIKNDNTDIESIELCGLCTDICVISNAMILKTYFPEVDIIIDSSCVAGVTQSSNDTALEAMKMVQIDVK